MHFIWRTKTRKKENPVKLPFSFLSTFLACSNSSNSNQHEHFSTIKETIVSPYHNIKCFLSISYGISFHSPSFICTTRNDEQRLTFASVIAFWEKGFLNTYLVSFVFLMPSGIVVIVRWREHILWYGGIENGRTDRRTHTHSHSDTFDWIKTLMYDTLS